MSHLVFIDTETTSLDDTRGEIWEIAAILRRPGQADAEHLWQIRPDLNTADPMSLRIGRYYERRVLDLQAPGTAVELVSPMLARVKDSPPTFTSAAVVAYKLTELLDGAHVVGAVPDFDARFLKRFLARHGECWTAHYHLIDVEALAVGWLHGKAAGFVHVKKTGPDWHEEAARVHGMPWDTKALSRAVDVDPTGFDQHTALGDARWARAMYDAITGGA